MHTIRGMAVIFSGLLVGLTLFAQQKQLVKPQQVALTSPNRDFVTKAAEANLGEIETGKMIEQRSVNPAVKAFASRMVADHTQASQNLATLAEMIGITLPTQTSATERTQKGELQNLSGATLDDAYLENELQGHKQVITAFESEIEHGENQEVKQYAEQTLPTLQDHIRMAENVAGRMGISGKGGLNQETKAIAAK